MRRPPNLSALRAFEAAARLGSFAAAAQDLNLTPAAISRAVRRLEQDLGYDLFHRSHRAVSLTHAGAQYAQRVTEGFRCFSNERVDPSSGRTHLVLDVEATFFRQWLLPRLCELTFDALDIALDVRPHHDPPRVISTEVDLAIVWGFADYRGFKRTRLVSPRTVLVASPALMVSELSEVAAKGLLHETNDHWWRLIYSEAGMAYPEKAREITLGRCDLPIEAARLGLGTAVGDDVIAEQGLKAGELVPVPGPRLDTQDYFLLTRTTPTVPCRAFARWLQERAAEFACWQKEFEQRVPMP